MRSPFELEQIYIKGLQRKKREKEEGRETGDRESMQEKW